MSEAIELSIDELHATNSEELVREVNEANRVKAGRYLAKVDSYKAIRRGLDDPYNPGRAEAQLTINLYSPEDPTARKGRVSFVTMSWESKATPWGGPDQQSRDWVAFLRAVDAAPQDTPGEVLEAGKQRYFVVDVELKVNAPADALHPDHLSLLKEGRDKAYVTVTTDEQIEHYESEGLEPKPRVVRFSRVK